MTIKTYSSRPSAVRGLARHLGVANNEGLDLASLIKQIDGQYQFDTDEADAAVGLGGLTEEEESLKLMCGHVNCPSCNVHLSNGLSDFEGMVERHGSERAALKHQKHQWACLGCNAEWGLEIETPKASNKTGRHYPNRERSTDDVIARGPSELVFEIADEMKGAKRKDVVDAAISKGVTPNTARAAYQHWRVARGLSKTA